MSGKEGQVFLILFHYVCQQKDTLTDHNSSPGNPWCAFILLMDDGREDSGGKLEVDSIYYFGSCVLAGRWHGQLVLLPVGEAEPEPWNGQ